MNFWSPFFTLEWERMLMCAGWQVIHNTDHDMGSLTCRYSLDRRGTWQSWTHYSAIRKTWGVTKTLTVTAGRRRQSYPKTHIGTSKLRSEVGTVWRICGLKGSYLHRGNDSTWCSRSGFAVEYASGVAVFPHFGLCSYSEGSEVEWST